MSFYSLKATLGNGTPYAFDQLRNRVVLIFNSATGCGFTPQLKGLQALANDYPDKLVVLGFPTDDFKQESLTDAELTQTCQRNWGVEFPMMALSHVNGANTNEVFSFLKSERKGMFGMLEAIKWNFEKFLIDGEGNVVHRYPSTKKPESMRADIENLIAQLPPTKSESSSDVPPTQTETADAPQAS